MIEYLEDNRQYSITPVTKFYISPIDVPRNLPLDRSEGLSPALAPEPGLSTQMPDDF